MNESTTPQSQQSQSEQPSPQKPSEQDALWKRRIGAFWVKQGRGGSKYLTGEISLERFTGKKGDMVRVNLLQKTNKAMAKLPDYELFLQREEVARDILNEDSGNSMFP